MYSKLHVKPYIYGRTPDRLRTQLIDWLRTGHKLLDESNSARDRDFALFWPQNYNILKTTRLITMQL